MQVEISVNNYGNVWCFVRELESHEQETGSSVLPSAGKEAFKKNKRKAPAWLQDKLDTHEATTKSNADAAPTKKQKRAASTLTRSYSLRRANSS